MELMHWSPLRDLDDLFDRYRRGMGEPAASLLGQDVRWKPAATIVENEKEFTIKADLPEVQRKDIDVNVENGVLTISGERRIEKSSDDEKEHRRESFYGLFTRSFALPENVDEEKIQAECQDGVLRIHLPKASSPQKQRVSIKVG